MITSYNFNFCFVTIYTLSSIFCRVIHGQTTIQGKIHLTDQWEPKLYVFRVDKLNYPLNPPPIDSIYLSKDGSFLYSLSTDEQGLLYELRLPPKGKSFRYRTSGYSDNWIHFLSDGKERRTMTIESFADSLHYSTKFCCDKISILLSELQRLKRPMFKINKEFADSLLTYPSKTDSLKQKYLPKLFHEIDIFRNQIRNVLDTAKTDATILTSIHYLNEAYFGQLNGADIQAYSKKIQNQKVLLVKNLTMDAGSTDRNRIGSKFLSDAVFLNVNGKKVEFGSIKSKFKVVDFWASWCGPCRVANKSSLPELNDFLHKRGIPLIGISIDTDRHKWVSAIRKDNTSWLQLIDSGLIASKSIDVQGVPWYGVLNDQNVIIYEAFSIQQLFYFFK
jgi:thiol-disulfide isomerase/thioredoxin